MEARATDGGKPPSGEDEVGTAPHVHEPTAEDDGTVTSVSTHESTPYIGIVEVTANMLRNWRRQRQNNTENNTESSQQPSTQGDIGDSGRSMTAFRHGWGTAPKVPPQHLAHLFVPASGENAEEWEEEESGPSADVFKFFAEERERSAEDIISIDNAHGDAPGDGDLDKAEEGVATSVDKGRSSAELTEREYSEDEQCTASDLKVVGEENVDKSLPPERKRRLLPFLLLLIPILVISPIALGVIFGRGESDNPGDISKSTVGDRGDAVTIISDESEGGNETTIPSMAPSRSPPDMISSTTSPPSKATPPPIISPDPPQQIISPHTVCVDTPGYKDKYNDGCKEYEADGHHPSWCLEYGAHGEAGKTPNENCCVCKEISLLGQTPNVVIEPSWEQSPKNQPTKSPDTTLTTTDPSAAPAAEGLPLFILQPIDGSSSSSSGGSFAYNPGDGGSTSEGTVTIDDTVIPSLTISSEDSTSTGTATFSLVLSDPALSPTLLDPTLSPSGRPTSPYINDVSAVQI